MNNLGILSSSSAYTASANSVYKSAQVSSVKDKQETPRAEISPNDEINDEAIISDEAMMLFEAEKSGPQSEPKSQPQSQISGKDQSASETQTPEESSKTAKFAEELTLEQKQEVSELKARDAEVKTHEQAHLAAASGISASAPNYEYQTGPDGNKYAVGGEVNISFTQGENPEENLANAQAMKAAALAPAQPSGQDRAVARSAERMIIEAKEELANQKAEATAEAEKPEETEEATGTVAEEPSDKPTAANEEQPAEEITA